LKKQKKMESKVAAAEILKRPYARMVTPDEDGSYFAEIVEFPGCFASGKTAVEALGSLESVAVDWINATLSQGQDIPDPMEANEYSGKFVVRMLKSLHKRAALWAQREGVSLNQFVVNCVAETVGTRARPMMMINSPATWSFHVGFSGGIASLPIVMGQTGAPQLATSAYQQLVPFSVHRPEAARA
jgi:antitoxin HicB